MKSQIWILTGFVPYWAVYFFLRYGSDGRKCLAFISDGNMQESLFEFIQTWLHVLKYYRVTSTKRVIQFLRSHHGHDNEVQYGLICTEPHLGGVAQVGIFLQSFLVNAQRTCEPFSGKQKGGETYRIYLLYCPPLELNCKKVFRRVPSV